MAQLLPKNFESHVESGPTALVPVVFFGDFSDYKIVDTEVYGHSGLMLSTLPIKVLSNDPLDVTIPQKSRVQCYPLLKEAPKIKEQIDLKRRKYRINDVTIKLLKADYGGEPISNHPAMSTLMNQEMRMWWVYPPYEFCNIPWTDEGEISNQYSALMIYRGMVRSMKETNHEITIMVEDRSQDVFHGDVPTAKLPATAGMRDDMVLKPLPMCYGYQQHAPHLVYSGDQIEGYACIPDRTIGGIFTRDEDDTVTLDENNTGKKVWIDVEDTYLECDKNVYTAPPDTPGSTGVMYYGNNYQRYPGYIHITKEETPLHDNPDIPEEITGYQLNPPADNLMQTKHYYTATVVEPYTSEDDYAYLPYWFSIFDGSYVNIFYAIVDVHYVGTDSGAIDGTFQISNVYDGFQASFNGSQFYFVSPYHQYRRGVRYSFGEINGHKEGTTVYEKFQTGTWWLPNGWQMPSWGGTPADPADDLWPPNYPRAHMWEVIPNHVTQSEGVNGYNELHTMWEGNYQVGDNYFPGFPYQYHEADWISHTNDGDQYDSMRRRAIMIQPSSAFVYTDGSDTDLETLALASQLVEMENIHKSAATEQKLLTVAFIKGLDGMQFYAETGGRVDPEYDSTI